MEILPTFVPCLYAVKYPEHSEDELERVFDDWANPMFLNDFFEENEKDLTIDIESAIAKAQSEAVYLRNKLIEFAEASPNQLKELFKNLNNYEYTNATLLPQQKARNRWLRLYAIKIEVDDQECYYVITGGAIKLDNQHLMEDKKHTSDELSKINKCRDYLIAEGVIDNDSFQEIFF